MRNIRLIYIIIFAAVSMVSTNAANHEKEFRKFLGKHDIAEDVKGVPSNSSYEFWKTVLDTNEQLYKFAKDMEKGRGAEKEALEKISHVPRFYPQYDESVIESLQGKCDTILMDMGIADLGINCSLHIVYDDEANAYAALTEKGFAICLTTGLLDKKGVNYNILKGYIAHEFAHGALMHQVRRLYAQAKKRRKEELLGGIAVGLNAVAIGAEAYATANGVPPSGTDYAAAISKIQNDVKTSTLKYSFQYDREQEMEADLIAFRFMENLGCGEDFINGLRILGTQYDALYSEYSDHPTIQYRIAFLQYAQSNPNLKSTSDKKAKDKASHPERHSGDDLYD